MKPIQELVSEHQAVLVALDLLPQIAEAAAEGDDRALVHLEQLLDFFHGFVDGCHTWKEETILFPELERRGLKHDRGAIGAMLSEHAGGREHVRAIGDALARLRQGESDAADVIRTNAAAYRDRFMAHIELENRVLFPMADRILTDAAAERVAEQFQAVARDRMPPEKSEAYQTLLQGLREAYPAAKSPAA